MRHSLHFRQLLLPCFAVLLFSAQLHAQVTKRTFNFGAPTVINLHDLAEGEKLHPVILKPRYVEQGEDRDNFIFHPLPLSSGAKAEKAATPKKLTAALTTNSPATSQNFIGVESNNTEIPPDINSAVGTTYAVEVTNQQFNIYTKSSGALATTLSLSTFFSASKLYNYYDPHIVYDPNNNRFIISIDAQTGSSSSSPSAFAVAVSATGDPTGSWYVYSVVCTPSAPTDFMDYDQLGFNNTWIVQTGNDFPASGSNSSHIYVWPIASLYAGTTGTATAFVDTKNLLLSPAATYDATENTEYLVSDYNGNSGGNGYVNVATITGTASAPVYSAGSQLGINQTWQDPSALEDAPQEGETLAKGLEAGDTRIHSVIYRNGSLWFTHTVYLPASGTITNAAIDWWQINPSALSVTQFDRIADANSKIWYYYPSLDVNANGDMLIGYSTSSSTTYGGAQYALRLATDPVNTLETAVQFVNGVAGYYQTYGGGRNRWGDFSGTAFDPVDGSFWTMQEWANTGNLWATQIAHIPDGSGTSCGTPTGLSASSITTTGATAGWSAVSGANTYNLEYGTSLTALSTVTGIATNSYTLSSLTANTKYYFEVQTVCASGNSSYSTVDSFTTTAATSCGTPTGLSTSSITTTGATTGWTAVTGANTYNLEYGTSLTALTTVTGITTNSYGLSSLTAGTKYYFEVQTVCAGGNSSYSAVDSFTTTALPCTVPTGLNATSITTTTATVGWTAVSGAASYTLKWGSSLTALTTVSGLTGNSDALSGLNANTKYYFEVQTVCSGSSSSFSTVDSFATSAVTYCASKGTSTAEFIKTVVLGTINNTTANDGGYGNFTNLNTTLTAGKKYTITLTPSFASTKYKEGWTVYIDYNQDGLLTGTGETVTTGTETKTATTKSLTFTVPKTAINGATRLRIQLQRTTAATNPCATITEGDVQDFTVTITGGTAEPEESNLTAPEITKSNIIENGSNLSIVPNPIHGASNATAVYNLAKEGNTTMQVIDLTGRVVFSQNLGIQNAGPHNYLLYNLTSKLNSGYYIVVLEQNNQIVGRNRFIVTK
jgi:hypothetical protein